MTRNRFVREMLAWLNARLAPPGVTIRAATPLFDGGLIDSIKVLEVIAWTELAIGRPIPDPWISMDNFASVRRIADTFLGPGFDAVA